MKLSSRYGLDILFVVSAAFLAVAAMAFVATAAGWVSFGVAAAVTLAALASVMISRRTGRKIGHGVIGVIGLWTVITALVFTGPVLTWLLLADAIALGVAAIGDLTAHELTTERVVHRLEVTGIPETTRTPTGRIPA